MINKAIIKKSFKAILIGLYILVSLKCILLVLGQELTRIDNQREIIRPPKPNNLPKSAVWYGHLDGGFWYDCHKTKVAYEVYCRVYTDEGYLLVEDEFEMYATQMREPFKKIPLKEFINQDIDKNYPMFFNGMDIDLKYLITLEPKNYSPDDKIEFK